MRAGPATPAYPRATAGDNRAMLALRRVAHHLHHAVWRFAWPWAVAVATAALAAPATAQDRLPEPVRQALAEANLPEDALAAAWLPLQHGDRPLHHQATRAMAPGSTMKLVTSAVALAQLGPNHRGFTELRSAAPVVDGVLQGDLVLRGGGDLELGLPQLWALLLELREAGIHTLGGDVVVDRTRYRPARADLLEPPFDDAPEWPYNVVPDALGLAGSLLSLELDTTGAQVSARAVPALPGLSVDASAMRRTDDRCSSWAAHWRTARREALPDGGTRLVLAGAVPAGCTVRARLQLLDRAELTERLLRWAWTSLGGRWSGRTREPATAAEVPAAPRLLARRQTRPWGEMLRHLNKQSDNEWTRLLYLELGAMAEPPVAPATATAPTAAAADAAVRRWFAQQGIATDGLVMDNGSGLSRRERITPQALAELVRAMWRSPHAADFLMSLPTVGVDGTMRLRLREGPASGRARLKTGTLRDVAALAGVAYDAEGRPWAVAMMVNHPTRAARGRAVMDAWVDHVARHSVHPSPVRPGQGLGPLGDGP